MTAAVSYAEMGAESEFHTLPLSISSSPRPVARVTARAAGDRPRRIGEVLPAVLARYGLELAYKKRPAANGEPSYVDGHPGLIASRRQA